MDKWQNISDSLPQKGREIKYIDSNNNEGFAFLCNCCGDEWRDIITGGALLIKVKYWKYT